MSELATLDQAALAAMTVPELRQRLSRSLQATAESLLELASIWTELERRGEDLSDLRAGFTRWLPLVAAGTLLPELVIRYAGRPQLLQSIAQVPVAEQQRLVETGSVEVYADGKAMLLPVSSLSMTVVRQVFVEGRILPASEQAASRSRQTRKRSEPERREYRVVVDRDSRMVRMGRMEVPIEEVLAAFTIAADAGGMTDAELRSLKAQGQGIATAECLLTSEEDERFRAACKARKIDRAEAVRRAVVTMHLL